MRTSKARVGSVVIKLNLEKACDKLEWGFLNETLLDVGLPKCLVTMIMKLVSAGAYRLVWNGECTDCIGPSTGLGQLHSIPLLMQGCPLSPYLFIICVEKLGQWIA